jgi:hypothetical protein
MVNQNKPAERSRHIIIQFFAVQEWHNNGDIILVAIPAMINIADAATEALSWVCTREMSVEAWDVTTASHHRPSFIVIGHCGWFDILVFVLVRSFFMVLFPCS